MANTNPTRRSFSDTYKEMIAKEFREAFAQLGTSYQAGKAVGRKYKIHPTQVERWAKELTERERLNQPPKAHTPHMNRYDETFRNAVVEEIRLGLPRDGVEVWSKLSKKYGVHNTTLRDWYRKAQGGPRTDPDTGKRTRGLRGGPEDRFRAPDDPQPQQYVPAVAAEPPPPRHYQPEDIERPPEVQWRMANGRPLHPEYLAQRVHELEHQVRVLAAEKQALMVALGLVNTHKVDVPT